MAARKKAAPVMLPLNQSGDRVGPGHHCMAHGCNLRGTFTPILYGETDAWQCFIHSNLPMNNWQAATAAINRAYPSLEYLDERETKKEFRHAIRAEVEKSLSQ